MKKLLSCLVGFCSCSIFAIAQSGEKHDLAYADSAFMAKDYFTAGNLYKSLITDTSHDAIHLNRMAYTELYYKKYKNAETHLNRALASYPGMALKGSILSRLARIRAIQNNSSMSIVLLDSAIANGYLSYQELDTLIDFEKIRHSSEFAALRKRLYNSIYPCYENMHAREFDFWIGEWDVYITGTNTFAGSSVIQQVAGGCAILENWNSAISEGNSLNFVDDSTNKWKQVWVGSYPNGKQDFVNGEYRDSAMRFIFTTADPQGHVSQGKFSFFNQGPDQVRQLNETSADNGITWTVSYDFTYRRKHEHN